MRTSFRILSSAAAISLLVPITQITSLIPVAHAFSYPQCSDGIDNDGDGLIDYPADPGCTSIYDNSESADPGVFLTVTDGQDTVSPGGAMIYIITLRQQRDPVELIDVHFHVPALSAVVATSDDGTIVSDGVSWSKVAVFQNNVRTLTVHVVANQYATPGQLLVAQVEGAGAQATDTTMVSTQTIPYPQNELQVNVTDNRSFALAGDTLNYVVTVTNPQPNAAIVNIVATVPPMLQITSAPGSTNVSGGVEWGGVTVNPNQTLTYLFTGIVDPRTPYDYPIQVTVRAGNVVASDRTILGTGGTGPTSLFATITDNTQNASRGDLLTYAIHVDNTSGRLEPDAALTASLPIYAEFVSATEGGTWDGNNVRWEHMQIAPGGSRDLSFTVRVRGDAPDGSTLHASVNIQGYTTSDDTQVGGGPLSYNNLYQNTVASAGSSVAYNQLPSLSVQKTSDKTDVSAGGSVTYTVAVRNGGTSPVSNVAVSDSYDPSAFTLTDAGTGQYEDGKIVWLISTLQPNEVRSFTYTGTLSRSLAAGSSVLNTARVFTTSQTGYTPTATSAVSVSQVLPQTGVEDLFLNPLENTAEFLSPISAAASGNGLPLLFWLGLIAGGVMAGGMLSKKILD